MLIAGATYETESEAARIADLLVSGSLFPPREVYVYVERGSELHRVAIGRGNRIGQATLIGAAVVAAAVGVLASVAAQHGVVLPRPSVPGVHAPADALLALSPAAVIGALIGAAVGAWRFRKHPENFPEPGTHHPAFVGVWVSRGNVDNAERVLRTDGHVAQLVESPEPIVAARHALAPSQPA